MMRRLMSEAAGISVQWDAHTDKGGREDNQDSVRVVSPGHAGIAERGWFVVVCDGVGGEAGGQIASAKAADAALQAYYDDTHGHSPRTWLDAAVKRAHLAVLREATTDSALRRMSTTLVAAAVLDGKAYIAHVGDSRAYLAQAASKTLIPLTRDHKNEATNSITRSLGAGANHDAEFLAEPVSLAIGDRLLLCTEGVYGVLDDATMANILACHSQPADAANAIVATSIQHHTDDNVTAAVLNFGEVASTVAHTSNAPSAQRKWLWALVPIGLAAVGLALLAPRLRGVSSPVSTPDATTLFLTPTQLGTEGLAALAATPTVQQTLAPILELTQQAQQTSISATRAAVAATQAAAAKTRAARPTATRVVPTLQPTIANTAEPPAATSVPSQATSQPQSTSAPPTQPTPIPPEATGNPGDPGTGRNPTATAVP